MDKSQRKNFLHFLNVYLSIFLFLNEVVNNSISVDDRDTILIGAIVCLSVCFHKFVGVR